jgi:hypothetical protein
MVNKVNPVIAADSQRSTAELWGRFRFSIVGSLLSSPPARGELKVAIERLAEKTWTHPVSGSNVRFTAVTIERWYYKARCEKDDPIGVLRRTVRRDRGKVSLPEALEEHLLIQYREHKHWSYLRHYNNLTAMANAQRFPARCLCVWRAAGFSCSI